LKTEPGDSSIRNQSSEFRIIAGQPHLDANDADAALQSFRLAVPSVGAEAGQAASPETDQIAATAYAGVFLAARVLKQAGEAESARKAAMEHINRVAQSPSSTPELKDRAAQIESLIDRLSLPSGLGSK
jgi:cystathionine beta-lyase family protein involved in aluminum resistance